MAKLDQVSQCPESFLKNRSPICDQEVAYGALGNDFVPSNHLKECHLFAVVVDGALLGTLKDRSQSAPTRPCTSAELGRLFLMVIIPVCEDYKNKAEARDKIRQI